MEEIQKMEITRLATYADSTWWKNYLPKRVPLLGSEALADFLQHTGQSLLIASRQADVVAAVSAKNDLCEANFYSVPSPMGLSVSGSALAVGCFDSIDVFQALPAAENDACVFMPIGSQRTGPVSVHDVVWVDGGIAFVNTLFSSLCITRDDCNFEILWSPRFAGPPRPIDACHLNGMAVDASGQPRFVTALASTFESQGWRYEGPDRGVLVDIESEQVVEGFSLPHSPFIQGNDIWLLESGRGKLLKLRFGRTAEVVITTPHLLRGMAICSDRAIIGTSALRPDSASYGVLKDRLLPSRGAGLLFVDVAKGYVIDNIPIPQLPEISSVALIGHRDVSFLAPEFSGEITYICARPELSK